MHKFCCDQITTRPCPPTTVVPMDGNSKYRNGVFKGEKKKFGAGGGRGERFRVNVLHLQTYQRRDLMRLSAFSAFVSTASGLHIWEGGGQSDGRGSGSERNEDDLTLRLHRACK